MTMNTPFAKIGSLLLLALLLVVGSGCDTVLGSEDDDHDHDHDDHGEMARVQIEARDGTGAVIAVWDDEDGWDTDALTVALSDDGNHPVWTVRMFEEDGDEVVLEEDGEFEARYAVDSAAPQNVIYFDGSGELRFEGAAATLYGEEGELFHGDHVHVYPQQAGTTQVRFLLWHDNHSDESTDLIDLTVQE